MAQEDSARTFSTVASGRAGSPYLQSFIQPAERERSAQFERELAMSREMRATRGEALAEEKAQRDEARDVRRAQEEQRRYERDQLRQDRSERRLDLAQRRQDAAEHKQLLQEEELTHAAEAEGKILGLDPMNMGFDYYARNTLQDPQVKRALMGPHGSTVLKTLNTQKQAYLAQLKHYQSLADEAGLSGDVRQWADKSGMMDEQSFSSALETARQAKQLKEDKEKSKKLQEFLSSGAKAGLEVSQMTTKGEMSMARPRQEKEDTMAQMQELMGNKQPKTAGKTPPSKPSSPLPVESDSLTLDDFPSLTP